ncbi:MAG: HAMP domain-containing sensor histidine kinase [Bacteroidota bacterium]
MKIQTKTTLLFTLLTGTIFLILNITVYFFVSSATNNDFNKRLELRTRISAKFRFEQGEVSTESFREIQKQYLEKLPNEQSLIYRADSLKKISPKVLPMQLPASYVQEITNAGGNTIFYSSGFRNFAGLLYRDETGDFVVIESATNEYGKQVMQHLLIIKIITFVFAVILIYSVGLYFAKKTFKPIRDTINRVKEISEGNLHLRLLEAEGSDEIAELTSTFNQMLNRLETAFEAQNNFISNASHELRTPLTAIVGEADFALSKERTVTGYQESIKEIMLQAERLQELTKGLLSLAQTGFDGKKHTWETIRIDELLYEVKANCNTILPDNKIKLVLDEMPSDEASITVKGNPDLLKIAIGNIAMNACKYSDNKAVTLKLIHRTAMVDIVITDSGIGIPKEELRNIYDPFFRASNTQKYDGFGIGMPLSNNIIRIHKGTISVHSEINTGTVVKISLPVASSSIKKSV